MSFPSTGPRGAYEQAPRARRDDLRRRDDVHRPDRLPGLTFPGELDSYPGRDDIVAYLTDYAQRFELPVKFNSRVRSVRPRERDPPRRHRRSRRGGAHERARLVRAFARPRVQPHQL